MIKYSIGIILSALYCASSAYALLNPIPGTSITSLVTQLGKRLDKNFFRSIITANNFSSFAFIEEDGITYCYAIINVGTLAAPSCKGIFKIALTQNMQNNSWEYIQPPSIDKNTPLDFIPDNRKPFLTKLGEHIVLVTRLKQGDPKKIYAYNAANNSWSEKCDLSSELTAARLQYITGTANNWWIKGCNKERLECTIKEVKTPKDFFKEKSFLENLNPLSNTLKSTPTPYTDVALAADGHNAWFIERTQDSNPKKQRYILKIINLNDLDEDEEFVSKSPLTSANAIDFSSLSKFVAVDDVKAFFIDKSKKNIYSISLKGNARLCETTQAPIEGLNVLDTNLIVAMNKQLYRYVPYTIRKTAFPAHDIEFKSMPSTEATTTTEVSLTATTAEGVPLITQGDALNVIVPEEPIENISESTTSVATPTPTSVVLTEEDESNAKKDSSPSKTSLGGYNFIREMLAQKRAQIDAINQFQGNAYNPHLELKHGAPSPYANPDTLYNRARTWVQQVTAKFWRKMW